MLKVNNKVFIRLTPCSSVSIVKFEQVNAGWVITNVLLIMMGALIVVNPFIHIAQRWPNMF